MRTARSTSFVAVGLAVVVGAGVVAVTVPASGTTSAPPTGDVNPAHFTHPQANPYFPLTPGTVVRYKGSEDGKHFREKVRTTHQTKTIEGVETTVSLDVLRRADGTLAEKTHDWYAADNDGNVWYFGEATATYDKTGTLRSREGSWKAGRDGAVAGLIMPADPQPTDAYRQEFYRDHAEDQAWIVQRNATVTVPLKRFHHVVRSFEWSRLERDVVSVKLYGRGVGIIKEHDLSGGNERFVAVSVTHG